ncbi:MAG: cation-translocating P-type ATPase [Syntrophaceae bacterium]
MREYYRLSADETIKDLGTSPGGLSAEEARRRLEKHGPNELEEKKRTSPLLMFLSQFTDFMILVLIAAAVISGIIGELVDSAAILVILLLNAVIGFVQEHRADKAMAALKKMALPESLVVRDGNIARLKETFLVPGDIVVLEAGAIVPADVRLTESFNLQVDEAALTGESVPVEKETGPLNGGLAIADRKNMAYKGTVITYGRGRAVVTGTGMDTELGKIAALLQGEPEQKTPLQKKLTVFGKRLALAVLAICAFIFVIGILRGEPPLLMLLTAVSLAVAAIPEALPAVITISLALGARKMVRQNALIRKLPAVETLGAVTYICSDKTGTLTQNRMTVEKLFFDGANLDLGQAQNLAGAKVIFQAMALNNDSFRDAEGRAAGDPTETALLEAAAANGIEKGAVEKECPRVAEIPFDSERKCMSTFHKEPDGTGGIIQYTKGAVDSLLGKSENVWTSEGLKILDPAEMERANQAMSAGGLRVLCVAMRKWESLPDSLDPASVESGLTILGLVGMMDPPRPEIPDAIRMCKTAGIRPVMITGDHPVTARAIAERIGLMDRAGAVITGAELDRMSLEAFEAAVEEVTVYARVVPEQKIKIVQALQDKGHIVAMTGDGINDAPALKRADIGIAMGITGTDVSKESSHMILLDDNFASIVRAVREGRKIYDNIRKFIKYLLTTNSAEIWVLFVPPLLGYPLPLLPIQILWVNLVTDSLPALALSVEPAEENIMQRPPRDPRESVFAFGLGRHVIWVGFVMALIVIYLQVWSLSHSISHWQTLVFTTLCFAQLSHVLAIRSERESLFRQGVFSNKPLLGAVSLAFALQMLIVYVPVFNRVFKTDPLTPGEILSCLALSSIIFIAVEIEKFFRRRSK